jgi:hypothetical protein
MTDSDSDASTKQASTLVLTRRYKPNFWERGTKSKVGDQFASVTQIGVGHALTNWEHVENAVSMLFSQFTEAPTVAAARAYGSIIGARSRYFAVSQAMNVFFDLRAQKHKRDRDTYGHILYHKEIASILLNNYSSASGRRNDIAHGICWKLSRVESEKNSWFLVPPTYNAANSSHWVDDDFKWQAATGGNLRDRKHAIAFNKMYYKNADYVFSAKELQVFAKKFAYLYADILSFLHIINQDKFPLTPVQLYNMARALSGMT